MDIKKDKQAENQMTDLDFSALEETQLRNLLDEAETDSEKYFAILEELKHRNPDMDAQPSEHSEDEAGDIEEAAPQDTMEETDELGDDTTQEPTAIHAAKPFKPLSTWGSRLWIVLTALFSFAGGFYFLYEQNKFGLVDDFQVLIMLFIVLFLTSLSYLLAGIRFVINRANGIKERSIIRIELWVMTALWALLGVFMLYNALNSIIPFYRMGYGLKVSFLMFLPMLALVMVALLLAMSFSYLAQELCRKE